MKTIEKLMSIINLLEKESNLRLQDISNALTLDKSTVHRFLKALLKYDMVKRDSLTGRYSLGFRFLSMGTKILESLNVRDVAHPYLEELGRLTGDTIHLTLFDGNKVVYIDKVESIKPIRMYSKIGNVVPLYCTGVGKVILAFQPRETVGALLSEVQWTRYTKNTITDRAKLERNLEEIRRNGFAVDRFEHEDRICCIAAPIWNHNRTVDCAISISTISAKGDISELLRHKDALIERANSISEGRGYRRQ